MFSYGTWIIWGFYFYTWFLTSTADGGSLHTQTELVPLSSILYSLQCLWLYGYVVIWVYPRGTGSIFFGYPLLPLRIADLSFLEEDNETLYLEGTDSITLIINCFQLQDNRPQLSRGGGSLPRGNWFYRLRLSSSHRLCCYLRQNLPNRKD